MAATKKRSSIHIKKSKRGSFKAMANKAGKSVQEEASSVLSNPKASAAAKKKANFARNATKWNHTGPRKSKGPKSKKK